MNAQTRSARATRDLLVVDLRGLKTRLVAHAQARRVIVSVLVRQAIERELDLGGAVGPGASATTADSTSRPASTSPTVKLSIRLAAADADRLAAGSQAAGLSRGAFLAGLIAGVPVLADGASRTEHVRALTASNAEMATLNRNIHHLGTLLGRGASQAAMQYRAMLATLAGDVRGHLRLSSSVLAALNPARGGRPPHPSA